MKIPSSTYRVQLNSEFTFRHLEGILDYIEGLGVSTIYASPILKSTPASVHGYDVVDPHQIDPEIGTLDEFRKLSASLRARGISWLQDIVPNHMAFHTGNQRLMDVLERGKHSRYYRYFDINWEHHEPALKGKVCVPFLGKESDECIKNGELKLAFSEGGFTVDYFDTRYPLSIQSLNALNAGSSLRAKLDQLTKSAVKDSALLVWRETKEMIIQDIMNSVSLRQEAEKLCQEASESPAILHKVLDHQNYLLMYWKHSEKRINYRRFFTVNELICLRMEEPFVFDEYHRLVKQLYDEGLIHGVRIDHIDGLFDPAGYVKRLRKLLGKECYIIAEKILEATELMPSHWELEGTSGYEFLSYINQLYTDRLGSKKLVDFYQSLVPSVLPYQTLVIRNKRMMLENYMGGEWENLTELFFRKKFQSGFTRSRIKMAISFFMISIPVYRIYPEKFPLRESELSILNETFRKAIEIGRDYEEELNHLQQLLTGSLSGFSHDDVLFFLKRIMQFTGPLTAKGVEDTTFYVYNPLISHDEVGDAPSTLGISIQAFHKKMELRLQSTPLSLNATATHDTKRGEDARLRLNVISELPEVWEENVKLWMQVNRPFRTMVNNVEAPSPNDEYFIYQSLLGGFPEDLQPDNGYFDRFREYLVKAMREAKVHTNWSEPNEAYEKSCTCFAQAIFSHNHVFSENFIPFTRMVIRYASVHALGQVLIKITAPGIPDMYQGSALWDLSYVDPDNRRPVDFEKRMQLLAEIWQNEKVGSANLLEFLRSQRRGGVEKLYVTWRALMLRKKMNEVFLYGDYIPLRVSGTNVIVISFARRLDQQWVLVVVPLGLAKNRQTDQPYAENPDDKLFVSLPPDAPNRWRNLLTEERLRLSGKLAIFDAFKDFPVALLVNDVEQ